MDRNTPPAGWRALNIDGFISLIGPLLRATNPEQPPRYALQTHDGHQNPIGLVHGGVLTSLLDQVIALEAWRAADRRPTVTVQLDTRFLAAAKSGDFLEASAQVKHATRSLMFVDAAITCGNRQIATATSIMKISPPQGQTHD